VSFDVTYVDTDDKREQFKAWLIDLREPVAVDTETTGLNPWHDKLRMVQFGSMTKAFCLPCEAPFWKSNREAIQFGLGWTQAIYVGHNSKFDAQFLHANGFTEWLLDDTKIMLHLLDSSVSTSLKPSADRWLGEGSEAQKDLKDLFKENKWTWATIPTDTFEYWYYAGVDTILTAQLFRKLMPLVRERYADLYDMEVLVWRAIAEAERRGMLVDEEYAQAGRDVAGYEAEAIAARWPDVNLGSPKQLAVILQAAGVTLPLTKKGNPSVTGEFLETLDHPIAKDVMAYRSATKTGSTYYQAALDLRVDDVVHGTINPMGARTGRMSSERPNMQNWPREGGVRGVFVPRPGHVFVSADYSQIEYRLFAHYSQEPSMIQAFLDGKDMHAETARVLLGREPSPGERQDAKTQNFTSLFGAGDEEFARTARISLARAKEYREAYYAKFPRVPAFLHSMQNYVRANGWAVETAYGRRIPVDKDQIYAGTNYMVQGTAADVLKIAICNVAGTEWSQYFILPIHDDLTFECPKELVMDLVRDLPKLMEVHDRFLVPLTIDIKVQERWGGEDISSRVHQSAA
jgi:DNA polymerase-1